MKMNLVSFLLFLVPIELISTLLVNIDVNKPAAIVDSNFVSVAIDSSIIKNKFKFINFESEKLLTLAKGLQGKSLRPNIYLRIGGSDADDIAFQPEIYLFNVTEFKELWSFVHTLQWELIFDLSLLLRKLDGTWDPQNAEMLINFAEKEGFYVHYELGNEPDLYPRHRNITIPPKQVAQDFLTLRKLLDTKTRGASKLFGPDVATLTRYNYFENIISNMSENVLDAVTFHHYYGASEHITSANFTSVDYLDTFITYGSQALNIIHRSFKNLPHPPVWIGETSSTYGGGSDIGMSYVAGFLWLDKLGLAAQMNIKVVVRQTLKGGSYSLMDKNYNPAPDYWSSALYKQLVGRTVLNVTGYLTPGRNVRIYAHCVNPVGGLGYKPYSIVLMILNLNKNETANIDIQNPLLQSLEVDQFLFSPLNGELEDTMVELNGEPMKMINDTALPKFEPVRIEQPIRVPPLRYGFYVLLNSYADACTYID